MNDLMKFRFVELDMCSLNGNKKKKNSRIHVENNGRNHFGKKKNIRHSAVRKEPKSVLRLTAYTNMYAHSYLYLLFCLKMIKLLFVFVIIGGLNYTLYILVGFILTNITSFHLFFFFIFTIDFFFFDESARLIANA